MRGSEKPPFPSDSISLSEAVERARANAEDIGAFARIYYEFNATIKRYLSTYLKKEDLEDVCQETWIRAWRALSKQKPEVLHMRAWLIAIAHNTYVDYVKERQHNNVPIDQVNEVEEHLSLDSLIRSGPEEEVCEGDLLDQALAQLARKRPQGYRCMELFRDGYKQNEIAKILNITEGTVSLNIRRCQEELRSILQSLEGGKAR
ncbi:MAG TPA: sigma-70 family RNA polymerase sigma factor [Ktedonobacteraceae bacterium]|nr:sigma-70 family RNA polymerase sigma factor [Ktedonobacteraceae bacterium]